MIRSDRNDSIFKAACPKTTSNITQATDEFKMQ